MTGSRVLRFALLGSTVLAVYVLAWPVPIVPVAWDAPRSPTDAGVFAPNTRLRDVEWLGRGIALGPEATAIDQDGNVYTGTRDGRVLRYDRARSTFAEVGSTGGRPLGLAFDSVGRLIIADARKGLLSLSPSGELIALATEYAGVPFRLVNDVAVGPDGTIYFTETSSRFGMDQLREDILEHGGRGRLFAYRPRTRTTELLLAGLQFANGVALSGDGSYLLVNEMTAYRITRFWLTGPKKGSAEPFFDNLPGLPDNITYSRARRVFWLALYSPRLRALDVLARYPFARKVMLRLPFWLQPQPRRGAFVLAIDEQGRVVENLQDFSPGAFQPVTSVREHDGVLYLGSVERDALGRIAAPRRP